MMRRILLGAAALAVACGPGSGTGGDGGGGSDGGAGARVRSCETTFTFHPDSSSTRVALAGEWNDFMPDASLLEGPDAQGNFTRKEHLPVGAFGYKFVVGDAKSPTWILDPANPYTKYVGGVENSLVEVDDCSAPLLQYVTLTASPDGAMHAEVDYVDGAGALGLDPAKLVVTLDGQPASGMKYDAARARITVDATGLPQTKHRLIVSAADKGGHAAKDLHVPFWVEKEPFDFRDGILYFAFTDRFSDGDPTNDAPSPNVDLRANYEGGDFKGIEQQIESGYFDQLGVRTIWISPPNQNPDGGYPGADPHEYSGYHGYWPSDGKMIQKRFGDAAAMRSMIAAAHAHGMRVIVDTVLNHVHEEHPYFLDHRNDGWFNGDGSCQCGGPNCDWDTHRLDCWFAPYLPDLDYRNFEAARTMVDDALAWARDYDVDGFRVDAVKHFLEIVPRRLRSKLRDDYQHGDPSRENLYYLVGETFTGGDDGGRALIRQYIGPSELTAQFDFPIYWNILGALASYSEGMNGLEGAASATDAWFGDTPMSPFFGNHDVPRFLSTANGDLWSDPKAEAWMSPPGAPQTSLPYEKLRLAIAFLFTQPGVPLIYYGDEIGLAGAGDPDNRRMMKLAGLSSDEQATLDLARKVGQARRELVALRRGKRYTLWVDMVSPSDLYVYARVADSSVAVIAINRGEARSQVVPLRAEVAIPDGTVLHDRLGGPSVTVQNGSIGLALGARTAAVLAP